MIVTKNMKITWEHSGSDNRHTELFHVIFIFYAMIVTKNLEIIWEHSGSHNGHTELFHVICVFYGIE